MESHSDQATWAGFSHDSEMAITAAHDSYVVIYSVATGEIIQEFKLNSPCYTAKFNNDGCYIIAAPKSGVTTIISTLYTHKELFIQDNQESFTDARYSPYGKLILTACENGNAILWNSNPVYKKFN